MKYLMTVLALSVACLSTSAFAADAASAPMSKQQSKMGECNKEAGDKKGDERKAFMKTCLSNNPAAAECDKSAAEKKLAGAAKNSYVKKCIADASPAASAPKK